MGSWHIFKAVAAKKGGEIKGFFKGEKKKTPVDQSLPLNIHMGGSIALDQSPFLVYGDAITMDNPGRECLVSAYGTIEIMGSKVHRFYLESRENEENKAVLQIVEGDDGLEECRLFTSLDEIYPSNSEEWAFWMDETEGYIGWPVFEDKEGNQYERVWDEEESGHVAPAEFTETVYLDRFGEATATINHTAMLYGRWIDEENEVAEYMFLSAEQHSDDTALVQIFSGIDILPESIKINY